MAMWHYIAAIGILLAVAALVTVEIRVNYRRLGKDDLLAIHLSALWGILGFKVEMSLVQMVKNWLNPLLKLVVKVESKEGRSLGQEERTIDPADIEWHRVPRLIRLVIKVLRRFQPAINYFVRHLWMRQFKWRTRLGLGDAAGTGVGIGALWGIKGVIYTRLRNNTSPTGVRPQVQVIPSFHQPGFATDFDCIFAIRTGHIIITGINFLWCLIFRKKYNPGKRSEPV
ncbi:MAG: DUF2953 domain-containing protein [Clostridia bacterium]|nr:DUF2953 domain-containing protein [Clostridia bacterium]